MWVPDCTVGTSRAETRSSRSTYQRTGHTEVVRWILAGDDCTPWEWNPQVAHFSKLVEALKKWKEHLKSASYPLDKCVRQTLYIMELFGYQKWKGLYRLSNSNAFSYGWKPGWQLVQGHTTSWWHGWILKCTLMPPLLPPPHKPCPTFSKETLRQNINFLVREFLIWPWNRGSCSFSIISWLFFL